MKSKLKVKVNHGKLMSNGALHKEAKSISLDHASRQPRACTVFRVDFVV
jgi:hypothetical protein